MTQEKPVPSPQAPSQASLWHIHTLESLAKIDRAIRGGTDAEQVMGRALDASLEVFDADRAWLLYPCDPEAPSWRVPIERTRPEYPGAFDNNVEAPMTLDAAEAMRAVLETDEPISGILHPGEPEYDPDDRFGIRAYMITAVRPKVGEPWQFGLHQCSHARVWTDEERHLFQEISGAIGDALSTLLLLRNLRESEEKYKSIFTSILDVYFETDAAGQIRELSPSVEDTTGYRREELIGESVLDYYAFPQKRNELIERIAAENIISDYEVTLVHKSRQPVVFSVNAELERDSEGSPSRIKGTLRDITKRKQVEKELADTNVLFEAVLNQSPIPMGLVSVPEHTILSMNSAARRISGIEAEEDVVGVNILEVTQVFRHYYPDGTLIPYEELPIFKALQQVETRNAEIIVERLDGSKSWELVDASPIYDADGEHIAGVVYFPDITDRKLAEAALRESEEKYRTAVDFTYDWEHWFGPDGTFVYVSPACERITGHGVEEFLADPGLLERIVHPDDRAVVAGHFRQVLSDSQKEYHLEFRILASNGEERWIDHYCQPVYDSDGKWLGQRASNRDITKRKQAERELADANALLEAVIRQSPVPMALVSVPDYRLRIMNSASQRILGIEDEGDLTGQTMFEFRMTFNHFFPNGTPIPREELPLAKSLQQIETKDTELVVERKDGTRRWEMVNAVPIYNDAGEHIAGFVIFPDITERKRAEAALRESEEKYRTAVDFTYDWEHWLGPDGDFVYVSPACERITGHGVEEFLADPGLLERIVHPDDRAPTAEHLQQVLSDNQEEHHLEFRVLASNGQERWIDHYCQPVYGSDGKWLGQRASNRDITKRKRAEEELRRVHDELETRVADRTRELSVLYEVATAGSQALNLEEVLSLALERVVEAVRSDSGAIQLLEEEATPSSDWTAKRKRLRMAVQQGLPPEFLAQAISPQHGPSLGDRVVEQGEMLIVPDMTSDPRTASLHDMGARSFVGVPLRVGGRTVGVLSVTRKAEQPPYSVEELSLLTSIAGQLGVAVESAWLRRRLEKAAVIEERERLARDLHDSVTQLLYTLNLCAASGQRALAEDNREVLADSLSQLGNAARQALREMRLMLYELRPPSLAERGLVKTLHRRLDDVERRVGVSARLLTSGELRLSEPIEQELYHIALEALNNALKHAEPTQITVSVCVDDDGLDLKVVDNGRGFALPVLETASGMGLVTMRERAERLGAVLTIDSAPGEGTQVKVSMPYGSKAGCN
jgi:PAS domain S-box-containing protein